MDIAQTNIVSVRKSISANINTKRDLKVNLTLLLVLHDMIGCRNIPEYLMIKKKHGWLLFIKANISKQMHNGVTD